MSRDLDARGRRAAAGLKAAIDASELTSMPPTAAKRSRRPLVAVLRPAIIMALLLIGAAIGVALVGDSSPPATTSAPVATTIPPVDTTIPAIVPVQPEPAPPTTAYIPPETTSTTTATDLEPPPIVITSPEEGAEFDTKTITFAGTSEPAATVASGRWEADVEENGDWSIVLVLSEGSNVARFTASDAAGNEATASITVFYVPKEAPTTTTTIKKELAKFSAKATFGSCAETPPYDIYYGTGEPGSTVHITSDYGSASVEVNAKGQWETKVIFENAPADKTFVVTVKDDLGRKKQFEFIYQPA